MIERLADAQRRLVDRSFDAGIAENASGVLHNLGNAMTPLGVNVAHLQQSLRGAPTADLDLVLTELAATPQDAERQRGLEEFLRLTSMELGRQLSSALQQVDVVAQQVHAIHDVLGDQQRLARSGRVAEVVEAGTLLTQSIELVPPALRKRLQLDVDDSCPALGRINVARTTVQQVFQNLIVNAAESIRDAGRACGTLRISAQVVAAPSGDHMHWCFADDGSGIAANDAARIFEKGFSTKSPSTNSGIGLHWCANVVTALGGSIRAESAGPGSGARFHVILPLERAA
jgi:signal transduction histidine kinase